MHTLSSQKRLTVQFEAVTDFDGLFNHPEIATVHHVGCRESINPQDPDLTHPLAQLVRADAQDLRGFVNGVPVFGNRNPFVKLDGRLSGFDLLRLGFDQSRLIGGELEGFGVGTGDGWLIAFGFKLLPALDDAEASLGVVSGQKG